MMYDWKTELKELEKYENCEAPFYTDYLYHVQEDYPNAGLGRCQWGDGTDIPNLYAHKTAIIEHFNIRYRFREIGAETESRFQYIVDRVFDNIKRKYDYCFMLYENNEIAELGRILNESYVLNRMSKTTGTSHNSNVTDTNDKTTSRFQDMPIQAFEEAGSYATNITNGDAEQKIMDVGDGTSESNVATTDDLQREKIENDSSILEQVNENIDAWRDLINAFVEEFKNCFINTLARI